MRRLFLCPRVLETFPALAENHLIFLRRFHQQHPENLGLSMACKASQYRTLTLAYLSEQFSITPQRLPK
jgi:hypothetical protein